MKKFFQNSSFEIFIAESEKVYIANISALAALAQRIIFKGFQHCYGRAGKILNHVL